MKMFWTKKSSGFRSGEKNFVLITGCKLLFLNISMLTITKICNYINKVKGVWVLCPVVPYYHINSWVLYKLTFTCEKVRAKRFMITTAWIVSLGCNEVWNPRLCWEKLIISVKRESYFIIPYWLLRTLSVWYLHQSRVLNRLYNLQKKLNWFKEVFLMTAHLLRNCISKKKKKKNSRKGLLFETQFNGKK